MEIAVTIILSIFTFLNLMALMVGFHFIFTFKRDLKDSEKFNHDQRVKILTALQKPKEQDQEKVRKQMEEFYKQRDEKEKEDEKSDKTREYSDFNEAVQMTVDNVLDGKEELK